VAFENNTEAAAPTNMSRFVGGRLNFTDYKPLDGPKSMRSLSGRKDY